jgi:hypothetical protein
MDKPLAATSGRGLDRRIVTMMSGVADAEVRACPDCGGAMPLTLDHRASAAGCETWTREWTCGRCEVTPVEVHFDEGEVTFFPINPAGR